MASVKIQHEFDCDEDTLWQVCMLDDDYSRQLYIETLRFPVWRIVEQRITDEKLVRRVEIQPVIDNVPSAIRSILGERFAYVEEGALDRKAKLYKFRIIPNVLPEKTIITGDMYTEPLGDQRVRRVIRTDVTVRLFAVGRLIEQKTIDDTRASHEKIAAFTRRYLRARQASP